MKNQETDVQDIKPKRRMKKRYFVLGFFVLLWGISQISQWYVGRDRSELSIQQGSYAFEAKRDADGVWNIRTEDHASYWFAMGYVQAWDREYQLTMLKLATTGRLSERFGEAILHRDRMARFQMRVSQREWAALATNSPVRAMAQSFSEGINFYFQKPRSVEPVEASVLGSLRDESYFRWEPWHVLAVNRFSSWRFSGDYWQELAQEKLRRRIKNSSIVSLLFNPFPVGDVYSIDPKKEGYRERLQNRPRKESSQWPPLLIPENTAQARSPNPSFRHLNNGNSNINFKKSVSGNLEPIKLFPELRNGASNSWLVADPNVGRGPTLCNDPHIDLGWPVPLYPVIFEVKQSGQVWRGRGFALPGSPVLNLGVIERGHQNTSGDFVVNDGLAMAITIANFANTQDLVRLLSRDSLQNRDESFVVKSSEGNLETKKIIERWSEWGPVVNEIFEELGDQPTALHWVGFRDLPTPLEFYLNRYLHLGADIDSDLANKWGYPSVNFSWIDYEGTQARAGMAVTGAVIERPQVDWELRDSQFIRSSQLSYAKDRPVWIRSLRSDSQFFVMSANHQSYTPQLASRLAAEWLDPARALRLHQLELAIKKEPWVAQQDTYSKTWADFVRLARKELSASELCGRMVIADCERVVAALDQWNGMTPPQRMEPAVVALWWNQFKWKVWQALNVHSDQDPIHFADWNALISSQSRVSQWMTTERQIMDRQLAELSAPVGKSVKELLLSSFESALSELKGWGEDPQRWEWGLLNRFDWLNPMRQTRFRDWRGRMLLTGQATGGTFDSPMKMQAPWSPEFPLEFPVNHVPIMRMCAAWTPGQPFDVKWHAIAGPSGNPFSDFSREF